MKRRRQLELARQRLVNEATGEALVCIQPEDTESNADGRRRVIDAVSALEFDAHGASGGSPALLKKLLADFAATGLPPAYIPKPEKEESSS